LAVYADRKSWLWILEWSFSVTLSMCCFYDLQSHGTRLAYVIFMCVFDVWHLCLARYKSHMLRSFAFYLVNCFITFCTVNVLVVVCNGNWEMSSEAYVTRNVRSSKSFLMMISWWSKHVGVILSVLMCDIWINVLLQTSALVGPLHIANWNARWNSEILCCLFTYQQFLPNFWIRKILMSIIAVLGDWTLIILDAISCLWRCDQSDGYL
jgi:hypothetical protein